MSRNWRIWLMSLAAACLFGAAAAVVRAQNDADILAPGNPPLTSGMAGKVVALLQWSLDVRFSNEQSMEIIREIISYWQSNRVAEINGMVEIIRTADGILRASPEERARAKDLIRTSLIKSMEEDRNDRLSQMVLKVYRSSHQAGPTARPVRAVAETAPHGFTGIYVGTRNFASSMNTVQMDYVTFLPDGNVYWTLPAEGLMYFDANVARRAGPDEWGTYQISGNTVRVSLGSGLNYTFVRGNGHLTLQPHSGSSAVRTYSFLSTGDGLKLSGTYRRFEGDPAIAFASDGRFRDEGVFRNFGTMSRPDGSTYQADGRGGTGTYSISQYTLELKYSDGRVLRLAFTALPEALSRKPVQSFRINYEVFKLD